MKHLVRLRVIVFMLVPTMFATGCATTQALWGVKHHQPVSVPSLALSPQGDDILVRYDDRAVSVQSQAYWLFASTNRTKNVPPEFVTETDSTGWLSIPVAILDTLNRTNAYGPTSVDDAALQLTGGISNHADRVWLRRANPKHADSVAAGTNALGTALSITNAPPEHGYYWRLSSSPPRYVSIADLPPERGYYAASFGDQFTLWREGKDVGTYVLPRYKTHAQTTVWRVALTPFTAATDTAIDATIVTIGLVMMGAGGYGM